MQYAVILLNRSYKPRRIIGHFQSVEAASEWAFQQRIERKHRIILRVDEISVPEDIVGPVNAKVIVGSDKLKD